VASLDVFRGLAVAVRHAVQVMKLTSSSCVCADCA
jgi:hypothetical protein